MNWIKIVEDMKKTVICANTFETYFNLEDCLFSVLSKEDTCWPYECLQYNDIIYNHGYFSMEACFGSRHEVIWAGLV